MALQKTTSIYLILLVAGLLFYLPLSSSDPAFIGELTKEDGFFENWGALFFLLTSLNFLYLYIRSKKGNNFSFFKTKKNIFFLLLALLFFLGFGEEISWGQRLFHISTPDYIKAHNMQGEINLHNLEWFHRFSDLAQTEEKPFWQLMLDVGRLYVLFWFTFCIAIPFANKINSKAASLFQYINIPIVPLWIGIFFLLNYGLSNVIYQLVDIEKYTPLMEIKETISSYFFLLVSYYFLSLRKKLAL